MGLRMPTPWKHPDSGTYYLRERIPAGVVATAKGRTVSVSVDGLNFTVKLGGWVKLSLRTKDATTAKERYREAVAALEEHWRLIRQEVATGPVRLTQRQTEALAGEYLRNLTRQFQDDPGDPDDWDAALTVLEDLTESAQKQERMHGEDADLLLQQRGLSVDVHSRLQLLEAMHRAYVLFAKAQERRGLGDYSPDPRAERFPTFSDDDESKDEPTATKPKGQSLGSPRGKPEVTLRYLFDLWAKEHSRAKGPAKTAKDFAQKVESLREYIGHDDARAVTKRNLIDWCDHLLDEHGLSAKTVADKYLAAVKAVLRTGVDKDWLTTNPATEVKVRKPKKVKERSAGFTTDEAKAILTAALRDPETLGGMSEKTKLAIRWAPWIGAYTGARITELTQLRREDFITDNDIACINITPEAGSVKNGQYRIVPLHPHLVEMGLLDFVRRQPEGYLFASPGETLESTHARCKSVSGKVSEWVRTTAGVVDPRVQPTHGWRHRFKTLACVADIPPQYADMIQGHSQGESGAIYREPVTVVLYREIQKLPRYEWAE
ncbi:tyrosine-type recombinase/integrase [uncultured Paracoccus sp.]|uniref:tyrosine-type recombinase/integrase n=1 Tax=uncultured Paracoccus sp. TaxID=189685 RepID=UPI00261FC718|nr:tyrosine-type recombinase/integrase [uncultured Paracoccus sp.]